MNTLQELIELQERFEPFLRKQDYTYIGPVDQSFSEGFMKNVNSFAPVKGFSRKFSHFLGDKNAIQKAIAFLPPNTQLRIFVINGDYEDSILFHDTIEHYCESYNIDFQV